MFAYTIYSSASAGCYVHGMQVSRFGSMQAGVSVALVILFASTIASGATIFMRHYRQEGGVRFDSALAAPGLGRKALALWTCLRRDTSTLAGSPENSMNH